MNIQRIVKVALALFFVRGALLLPFPITLVINNKGREPFLKISFDSKEKGIDFGCSIEDIKKKIKQETGIPVCDQNVFFKASNTDVKWFPDDLAQLSPESFKEFDEEKGLEIQVDDLGWDTENKITIILSVEPILSMKDRVITLPVFLGTNLQGVSFVHGDGTHATDGFKALNNRLYQALAYDIDDAALSFKLRSKAFPSNRSLTPMYYIATPFSNEYSQATDGPRHGCLVNTNSVPCTINPLYKTLSVEENIRDDESKKIIEKIILKKERTERFFFEYCVSKLQTERERQQGMQSREQFYAAKVKKIAECISYYFAAIKEDFTLLDKSKYDRFKKNLFDYAKALAQALKGDKALLDSVRKAVSDTIEAPYLNEYNDVKNPTFYKKLLQKHCALKKMLWPNDAYPFEAALNKAIQGFQKSSYDSFSASFFSIDPLDELQENFSSPNSPDPRSAPFSQDTPPPMTPPLSPPLSKGPPSSEQDSKNASDSSASTSALPGTSPKAGKPEKPGEPNSSYGQNNQSNAKFIGGTLLGVALLTSLYKYRSRIKKMFGLSEKSDKQDDAYERDLKALCELYVSNPPYRDKQEELILSKYSKKKASHLQAQARKAAMAKR